MTTGVAHGQQQDRTTLRQNDVSASSALDVSWFDPGRSILWKGDTQHGVAIALAGALMAADTLAQAPAKQASVKLSDTTPQAMHRLAIQVDQNDKAVMDLALNNAKNVIDYYASKNESVAVEVVTFGPGLHMLRSDTSPVKERIAVMSLENSNLTFAACGNTQANQSKVENKPVVLITEAKVTPSGVVRLMELQKQGYAYIRP
jgi:intracellular sulfur oxidation DsrE/DsrF family protein